MKLEKFKKYGKRNKKIIGSVIGIILIICGVLLFKSFAFFDSKYDFNIIKGRVPNFTAGDVTLAFTIDGVKSSDAFPNKGSIYAAKSVNCANGVTASWNNEIWSLENLNLNGQKKISCNIDFVTSTLYNEVKIGDYVSYTPSSKSYTISKNLTGHSSDQIINPSELNLWRVIRKNEDGTIDMVSEYVSSTVISFYGMIGYGNYIDVSNKIAQQYETKGITNGSRCMGYSSTDTDLVKTIIGNLGAYKNGTTINLDYWLGKVTGLIWDGSNNDYISVASVYNSRVSSNSLFVRYRGENQIVSLSKQGGFRPIVILKNKNVPNGNGSKDNPWKIN